MIAAHIRPQLAALGHCHPLPRFQSTSTRPEVFVSRSHSPLFNLSFEEHLLRTRPPQTPLLFIYRNTPCIVIGRNQNHWKELNVAAMKERKLPLVRRRSGGGAVYHDLGNTNFSFHVARDKFQRRIGAEMIARALNGPGVGLRSLRSDEASPAANRFGEKGPLRGSPEGVVVNERHDLVVRCAVPAADDDSAASSPWTWSERKISGSAFKILTHRAYHHGTMLLDSDLSALGSSLRNTKSAAMQSKGVESVKSPVVNLSQAYPEAAKEGRLSHDSFTRAVVQEFWKTYDADCGRDESSASQGDVGRGWVDVDESLPLAQEDERVKLEKLLGEWDWIFASCPEFETRIELSHCSQAGKLQELGLPRESAVKLHCKNGIILDAELRGAGDEEGSAWHELVRKLQGQHYDAFAECPPLPEGVACERPEGQEKRQRAMAALGEGDDRMRGVLVDWLHEAL